MLPSCRLREKWFANHSTCYTGEAITSAEEQFRRRGSTESLADSRRIITAADMLQLGPSHPSARKNGKYQPMGGFCSVLARKFDGKGVEALLQSAADCRTGFGFGPACIPGRGS